jgi:hypothetical protein
MFPECGMGEFRSCVRKRIPPDLRNDRGLQVTHQPEMVRGLGYPVGFKYMGMAKAECYVFYLWQTAALQVKYSYHSNG